MSDRIRRYRILRHAGLPRNQAWRTAANRPGTTSLEIIRRGYPKVFVKEGDLPHNPQGLPLEKVELKQDAGDGLVAVLLGCTEALAYTTGSLTVSALFCRARRRRQRLALAALFVWLASLARHLTTFQEQT